jgi:hypothetical protein
MKTKPTVKILICVLAAGSAFAQSPSIIQNTRNTMNAVSNSTTAASNEALGINQSSSADANRSSQARTSTAPASATNSSALKSSAAKSSSLKSVSTAPKTKVSVAKVSVTKASVAKAPAVGIHARVKPAVSPFGTKPVAAKAVVVQPVAKKAEASKVAAASGSEERGDNDASLPLDSKYAANGRRDPFISPVVSHAGSTSSCSSGKKCLEIGTLNLRGVVHGETGFIAVVSNGLNKAYFLRENDPVFNGYVVKITGDSIIFQETLQDRLGKSFTREVTKKIITPAV